MFLSHCAAAGAAASTGMLFPGLPRVSADEAQIDPDKVRFTADIEPLVKLLEETPREKLLEEVALRIKHKTTYKEILSALLLAGVRNIQPRPLGFKFHAVLVVNSAHLASLQAPEEDRWLPIFWALDQFKSSQARDVQEGNWTLGPVDEARVPTAEKTSALFEEAMESWDLEKADVAAAAIARHQTPQQSLELFAKYGARDFRDIGHKVIYVANSWRTLEHIGWQHAEGVLRSLAYGLLEHDGPNPSTADFAEDRAGRRNLQLAHDLPQDWLKGVENADPSAPSTQLPHERRLLDYLRRGNALQAGSFIAELLRRGVSVHAIWDCLHLHAAEMLMRHPGIVTLHASTSLNAMRFLFDKTTVDHTRRFLLLQAAAFMVHFRDRSGTHIGAEIQDLTAESLGGSPEDGLPSLLEVIGQDNVSAARMTLGYLQNGGDPNALKNALRRLVYMKGTDSHDYKFSVAVFEDHERMSKKWSAHQFAASVYWLKGAAAPENGLVQRTKQALA